jgi:hypothetical protein
MNGSTETYDEVEAVEGFDDAESMGEATPLRPGTRVFAPGGLSTATLLTPRGPAKLNLPAAVPTLAQFRTLERALNANTQRVNAVQSELGRVRRELALRTRDPQGQSPILLLLLFRQLFSSQLSSASGSGFSSLLPILLLLQPGLFGQFTGGSSSGTQSSSTQDAMSPLLMLAVLDLL